MTLTMGPNTPIPAEGTIVACGNSHHVLTIGKKYDYGYFNITRADTGKSIHGEPLPIRCDKCGGVVFEWKQDA